MIESEELKICGIWLIADVWW